MTKYHSQGFEGLLTINSLEAEDSDVYTCEAIQESPHDVNCNNIESFNISLQVNYAPVFEDALETEIVYQPDNESVDLVCSANGFPTPTYTWFRDLGETLFEFSDERVNLQDGAKAVLTLLSNASTSAQRYRCRAKNQYGESSKLFTIVKLESPTKPGKIIIQEASHDSINLYVTWPEEMRFPVNVIEVQYIEKDSLPRRKIENLKESDWRKSKKVEVDLDSAGDVEANSEGLYFTLNNVEADTEYWIRLRAGNQAGVSPWSEPTVVRTTFKVETEAPEDEDEAETKEDEEETVVNAELVYSDATFYGVFFTGGIIVIAVACMFLMRLV